MLTAAAFVPLWHRASEWERRLAMVREARRFLYLSTYYIEYDRYGIEMLQALVEAQQRGVAVTLLIDGFGQRLGGVLMSSAHRAALSALLDRLRAAGGAVTVYQPAGRLQRHLGGGQHVKIQVSEAGEAIFGSSNLTRASFEGWNEYSVSLRGSIVPALLESYRAIGGAVDDSHLRHLKESAAADMGDLAVEYWFCNPNRHQGMLGPLGWTGSNLVTDRLVARIAAARRSLLLTSFYFKPVEPLLTSIVEAAARGVHVEVHHSHRDALPATELAWIASASNYDRLLGAGVSLYENRHGEHSKIVLVDHEEGGGWAAFGSYNFEYAAHDRLAEAMIATSDPRAVAPAVAIFAELRAHPDNGLVTPQVLRDLPARLQVKRRLLGRFKRWM